MMMANMGGMFESGGIIPIEEVTASMVPCDTPVPLRIANKIQIGKGSFGTVFSASLLNSHNAIVEQVAIKTVKHALNYANRELPILKDLFHPNVIKLMYHFYTTATDFTVSC